MAFFCSLRIQTRLKRLQASLVCPAIPVAALFLLSACTSSSNSPTRGVPFNRDAPVGTIARPVGARPESSRSRMQITPIGSIRTDGQTLPLVSPDGRFLASQRLQPGRSAAAALWNAILAEPAAEPPTGISIVVHDLEKSGTDFEQSARQVELPPGTILGRSADSRGFLVERLLDDGSRWIGLVDWNCLSTRWLIADEHHNALATLGPRGELCWSRTRLGVAQAELVLLPDATARRDERRFVPNPLAGARATESLIFPVFSGEIARDQGSGAAFYTREPVSAEGFAPPAHVEASERDAESAGSARPSTRTSQADPPGFPGLWCVAMRVPESGPSGDQRESNPHEDQAARVGGLSLLEIALDRVTGQLLEAQRVEIAGSTRADASMGFACVQTPWPREQFATSAPMLPRSAGAPSVYQGLLYFDTGLAGMVWLPSAAMSASLRATSQDETAQRRAVDAVERIDPRVLIAPASLGAAPMLHASRQAPAFVVGEPDALCYRALERMSRVTDANSGFRCPSRRTELWNGSYVPWFIAPNGRSGDSGTPGDALLLLSPPSLGEDSAMRLYRFQPLSAGDSPEMTRPHGPTGAR